MDAFLSQRARIARHFDSHAKVRSTTHRRAGAFHPLSIQFLLLHAPDVSPVPVTRHGLVAGWITVSLVQTRVLNSISRPIHYYAFQGQRQAFQGQRQQLGVVNIGSSHPCAQRSTSPVNQEDPLAGRLGPVCRVGAD